MVEELHRFAGSDGIRGCRATDFNAQRSPRQDQPEREPRQAGRQSGCEAEGGVGVAHPSVAGYQRCPDAGQRCHVQAVGGVVLQVVEVHQGGFGEVVLGKVEVTDLGCDNRLYARG